MPDSAQCPEIMKNVSKEKEEIEVVDKGDLVRQKIKEIERNQKNNYNKVSPKSFSNPEQKSQKTENTSGNNSEKISGKKTISETNSKLDQKDNFDPKNKGKEGNNRVFSRSPLSLPLSESQKGTTELKEIERKEMRAKQRQEFESFKMNKRAERNVDVLGEVSDSDLSMI